MFWHSARCYQSSPKVNNPSHSVLYLSTGILSQNEVGILLKWLDAELEKPQNLEKENVQWEIGFCNVIHEFSFFKHPWPLEMKFLLCSEHILGSLHLKFSNLTKDSNRFNCLSSGMNWKNVLVIEKSCIMLWQHSVFFYKSLDFSRYFPDHLIFLLNVYYYCCCCFSSCCSYFIILFIF